MGIESVPEGETASADEMSYRVLHAAVMCRLVEAQSLQRFSKDKRYVELDFVPGEEGEKLAQFVLRERVFLDEEAPYGREHEKFTVAVPIRNFSQYTPRPIYTQGDSASFFVVGVGYRSYHKNEGNTLKVDQKSYGRLFTGKQPIISDILGKLLTYDVVEP